MRGGHREICLGGPWVWDAFLTAKGTGLAEEAWIWPDHDAVLEKGGGQHPPASFHRCKRV